MKNPRRWKTEQSSGLVGGRTVVLMKGDITEAHGDIMALCLTCSGYIHPHTWKKAWQNCASTLD